MASLGLPFLIFTIIPTIQLTSHGKPKHQHWFRAHGDSEQAGHSLRMLAVYHTSISTTLGARGFISDYQMVSLLMSSPSGDTARSFSSFRHLRLLCQGIEERRFSTGQDLAACARLVIP
ncbi:hypothetical protein F4604DRAFT_1213532 [Suillus subluteus]|nr:hypothetical protein F4604DRAFT_1213532 [Suillus subluteus]